MAFLSIPGNIHQSSKIFVLNKENKINAEAKTSRDLGGAKAQVFTYKSN